MRSFVISACFVATSLADSYDSTYHGSMANDGSHNQCQNMVSYVQDRIFTTDNPQGIVIPDSFIPYEPAVEASHNRLCIAPYGQHCLQVTGIRCHDRFGHLVEDMDACRSQREYFDDEDDENTSYEGQIETHMQLTKDGASQWVKMSPDESYALRNSNQVCFHAPQDDVADTGTCRLQMTWKLDNGDMHGWSVNAGKHNVPDVDGRLDNLVLFGRGCMMLRYADPDQQGEPITVSEGYHTRFAQLIKSVEVVSAQPVICKAGEELDGEGLCTPCAPNFASRAGDNHCVETTECSHVSCQAVTPDSQYKKCPVNTYAHSQTSSFGDFSWMHGDNDGENCEMRSAPGFFLHVFHHGHEEAGTHHRCALENGTCKCRCYDAEMMFKPILADCEDVKNTAAAAYTSDGPTECFAKLKQALENERCIAPYPADHYTVEELHAACEQEE
jgi:hypothetical protein